MRVPDFCASGVPGSDTSVRRDCQDLSLLHCRYNKIHVEKNPSQKKKISSSSVAVPMSRTIFSGSRWLATSRWCTCHRSGIRRDGHDRATPTPRTPSFWRGAPSIRQKKLPPPSSRPSAAARLRAAPPKPLSSLHIGRRQSSVTPPRRPLAAIPFSRACLFPLGVFILSEKRCPPSTLTSCVQHALILFCVSILSPTSLCLHVFP